MSTDKSTIEYLLDQLSGLGDLRARSMFGEYALYYKDKVVALVCDDTLFIKPTEPGKVFLGALCEEMPPYPGARPWILAGAEELENRDRLAELVRLTYDALPPPAPKKPRKKKSGGPAGTR